MTSRLSGLFRSDSLASGEEHSALSDQRNRLDVRVVFARVISVRATVAYLGDVFVLEEYRRQGLSKWLLACVNSHPDLQGLRRWMLATSDAHGLHEKFGFSALTSRTCSWSV
jgi:GNAT superfamily N-acetyltransferase